MGLDEGTGSWVQPVPVLSSKFYTNNSFSFMRKKIGFMKKEKKISIIGAKYKSPDTIQYKFNYFPTFSPVAQPNAS